VGGAAGAEPEQRDLLATGGTPVMQAKDPWYLARTFSICGQPFSAWSSRRAAWRCSTAANPLRARAVHDTKKGYIAGC
jgi:hypothetical protein